MTERTDQRCPGSPGVTLGPSPSFGHGSARADRPGQVVGIDGVVFQCDIDHPISSLLIRPIEELSLRFRGR